MAIEFMDNFSLYGSDEAFMLNGIYAERQGATLVNDPDPNETGTVIFFNPTSGTNTHRLRKVLSGNQTTVGVAVRVWMAALPNDSGMKPLLAQFADNGNNLNVTIAVTPTGAITVRQGDEDGSEIAVTSGPVLVANAWHHVETKCTIHNSTGAVEIRVDGIEVLNATDLDTVASGASANCAQIRIGNNSDFSGNHVDVYMKDLIIWNDTGSVNDDFVGPCKVITLLPDGDSSFNWTPSTGSTGWDLIDEVPPNDETDYISADDAPPSASVFTLSDLPEDVTSVRGLMTLVRARKTDGGDAQMQVSLISNGNADDGADRAITTAYTYWMDVSDVSPDTSSAWTPAEVDAATISIDRTV